MTYWSTQEEPAGKGGLGMTRCFWSPSTGRSLEIKNRISHRGKALAELKRYLEEVDCNNGFTVLINHIRFGE